MSRSKPRKARQPRPVNPEPGEAPIPEPTVPVRATPVKKTVSPTVRMSKLDRLRVQAAAERSGYASYTVFMRDVVLATVSKIEAGLPDRHPE